MSIPRKTIGEDYIYFLPNEGDECFAMEFCGTSYCLPHYACGRDFSPIWVFEYICRGRGTFKINGLEFHPGEDDVYIAHSQTPHLYKTDPADPWVKIYFNVSGTLVESLVRQYSLENCYYIEHSGLGDTFRSALKIIQDDLDHAHEISTLAFHKVVFQISRTLKQRSVQTVPAKLQEIRHFLESAIFQSVSMEEAAYRFGLSVSQLNRLFRNAFGQSPYQYLLDQKLRVAKLLLQQTRKTVKDIAAELHFADEYYFSNFFRKKCGCSPTLFRRDGKM